ncbi:MAG TPA: UDP-N-acetylglucosamine 2-epimerase (non-hydrolyzing) [Terriglobales bacterium]|nr:UDP-N-acetylglucosamine 2-epimerase (non-hydrolyzing) [Terriglobales bacterium]
MTKRPLRVMTVFGTRPEAIKLAPVVRELRTRPDVFQSSVCVTGQHREMVDQVIDLFSIHPDFDLKLMQPGQRLAAFAARALAELDVLFRDERPDIVVVQGDTTTTLVASLAAFYNRAMVAHVEAGLRSFDMHAPFPEEINRTLTSRVADFHFAPTERAGKNLFHEGIRPEKIFVTGNTIVDALQDITTRLDSGQLQPSLSSRFPKLPARFILVTAHRRENQGEGLREIFLAIRDLTSLAPDVDFIFPVHLNPEVQGPAHQILGSLPRVHLLSPIDYVSFVWLMKHCTSILSDSGGIQEEAPSLRKRVVVMRDVTERPEAVESGWAQMVGTDRDRIIAAVIDTLHVPAREIERAPSPFGDGTAARKIADILAAQLDCQGPE